MDHPRRIASSIDERVRELRREERLLEAARAQLTASEVRRRRQTRATRGREYGIKRQSRT